MIVRKWKSVLVAALVFAFVISVKAALADDAKDEVELAPHWKQGDKVQYEMVRVKTKSEGIKTSSTTARTKVEIEVLKVDPEATQLRWTTGETTVDDPRIDKNDPGVQKMSQLMADFSLVLELTPKGTVTGVANWKEAKEKVDSGIRMLKDRMRQAGLGDDAAFDNAAAMFATKEQVEALCARDCRLFLAALGKSYSVAKPLEYEGSLPNAIAGVSLPCRSVFVLKSFDQKTGQAVIDWKQIVDPPDAKRVMENNARAFGARIGKPAPDRDLFKRVELEDAAEFSIDVDTGWVNEMKHSRHLVVDDRSVGESLTIKRTDK